MNEVIQIEKRILVVNEDMAFSQAFQKRMQNRGISVNCAQSEMRALNIFISQECSLVVLDIHPSNQNRLEMLRIMHSAKHIPILALIPPLEKDEKIALFHAGVDVCLDKATDIEVCVAQAETLIQSRLKTNIDRENEGVIEYGTELIIDSRYRQVTVDGELLELTRKEFNLLYCLARHPGQVFSLEHLYAHVWNEEIAINGEETVRVHIQTLRRKLSTVGKEFIQNTWGVGYKFVPPV